MPRPAVIHRDDELDVAPRKPGEFARNHQGAPWVVSVDRLADAKLKKAELVELCAKHGIEFDPKATVPQLKVLLGDLAKRGARVLYGRPSSLGKQIENTTNLQKWAERAVALGLLLDVWQDSYSITEASELGDLGSPYWNLDDDEARDVLDAIAVKAKNRARAGLAADRGTHGHELTEDHDNELDIIERITRGEELGLPEAVQYALVGAWQKMLAEFDLEILAVEATCVDDVWHQAGTLDRIARLRKDLRFVLPTGAIVVLPAGWVGILDIKTGKLRLDDAGFVSYWLAYAVQLASYAQSVPYDPDTDTRGTWPFEIDQRWAIIAHLDILAALDGEAKCRLVLVDLEAGRHAGALCVAAREWEKRTDVFSIPTDDLCVSVPVEVVGDGAGSDGSDRVGSQVPSRQTTHAESHVRPSPTQIAEHGSALASAADARPGSAAAAAEPTSPPAAPATPPAVEQPAAAEGSGGSSAAVGPAPEPVPVLPAPVRPLDMSDEEVRTAYFALDETQRAEVARLRDEHIVAEAGQGRLVSKRDATALALGWVQPFDVDPPPQAKCRSCGAPIVWAETKNGKPIPLDSQLVKGGNLVLVDGVARAKLGEEVEDFDGYISHFATCPNANQHRKRDKTLRFTGDEGDTVSEAEALEARGWIERLMHDDAEAFAEVRQVAKQADDAGVGFHILQRSTRRRWEIYRGLANLARYGWAEELVRDLLAAVTGDDACRQPAIAVGEMIGLLDCFQAETFAEVAARLVTGSVTPAIADDGRFTFEAALVGAGTRSQARAQGPQQQETTMPREIKSTTSAPFLKLVELGDTFVGAFAGSAQRQARNFKSGKPDTKADGAPRMEEIMHFVAMPGTTAKVGNAESGYSAIEPGDHVRFAVTGFQWGQVIQARKDLPAAHGFAAGKICSSDVYTFKLASFSASTDNVDGARRAGFTVVDSRIVMTTQEQKDQYVLARSRQNLPTGTGKDLTVVVRRIELPNEQKWADLADELYDTEPWATPALAPVDDGAPHPAASGGTGGGGQFDPDEEPFLRDATVADL